MFNYFKAIYIVPFFLSIFISIFFIPLYNSNNISFICNSTPISLSSLNSNFIWPTPGYKSISSYFGYRKSPIAGASSYHSGIDILAPQGTNIKAIESGYVSFVGFDGGNGYCVKINHDNNNSSTYAHVSPNFVVKIGDYVNKGTTIANVGPKYIKNTNYSYVDSSGKHTNGATTGPHLHLAISKNGKRINPLDVL